MKTFRTELSIAPSPLRITLKTPVLTAGSCFSDSIGALLLRHKFQTSCNPFGVIYNPLSLHKALSYALHNELPPSETYVENNGLWNNFDFHSSFSDQRRTEVQQKIADTVGTTHYFLKDAEFIIITYGTAWTFERADTGEPVANCHKIPAQRFNRRLLSVDEIVSSFDQMFRAVTSLQPKIKFIVSVSPVRHLKDTFELNNVSKSVLRLALHQIASRHKVVDYFAAFELVMDDLRDYRFYASDMLHPSEEAISYIWEKFGERYFDNDVRQFIVQWRSLLASINHTPSHAQSESHRQFQIELLRQLTGLESIINVNEEMEQIRSQLRNPTTRP